MTVLNKKVILPLLLSFIICFQMAINEVLSSDYIKITGTYSDMYYNDQGGDLLGHELRIVQTNKGYQGTIQFADGEGGELILIEIRAKGNIIGFTIPSKYQETGKFEGKLLDNALIGKFTFKTGAVKKFVLKKGKSYWD